MVQKVAFSQNSLNTFAEALGVLQRGCFPPLDEISPIIHIDRPRDYICDICRSYSVQTLNDMVQANEPLPPNITCIKMNGVAWFSDVKDPLDFYSTKQYVELGFGPQRLMNPQVFKDQLVVNSVKKMLAMISQGNVSESDLSKVFTEDVCRKVYQICPPREYIFSKLKDAMEPIRRTLMQHLINHHANDIQQLADFQAFQLSKPNARNPLREFLRDNYRVFLLAESWGYIKNGQTLAAFQSTRDIPRHMSKMRPDPILSGRDPVSVSEEEKNDWIYNMGYPYEDPVYLYCEIRKALPFVQPKTPSDIVSYEDDVWSTWVQKDIEKFKKIRASYPYANKLEVFLQNSFPKEVSSETVAIEKPDTTKVSEQVTLFSSFYVRKSSIAPSWLAEKQPDGSIVFKEEDFHEWPKLSDNWAHANPGYQQCAKILCEDAFELSDFVEALAKADERNKAQQVAVCKNTQQTTK